MLGGCAVGTAVVHVIYFFVCQEKTKCESLHLCLPAMRSTANSREELNVFLGREYQRQLNRG